MNNKFKKLSVLLLISGATLLFADAQTTYGQSYQEKKEDLNLTSLQRKAFIAIAGVLKDFGDINMQDNFLAPNVKVGAYHNPTDLSFKSFKSILLQFLENNPTESITEMKTNLGNFFLGFVTQLDDDFLDEAVKIPESAALNGRSARSFSQYVDGIIGIADSGD